MPFWGCPCIPTAGLATSSQNDGACTLYLVSNSLLSHARFLRYRKSKRSDDYDSKRVVEFGTVVQGIPDDDGWVRVGSLYLPKSVDGRKVLIEAEAYRVEADAGYAYHKRWALGVPYRNSTRIDTDYKCDTTAPWGALVTGFRETGNFVRVGSLYLPIVVDGVRVLVPEVEKTQNVSCDGPQTTTEQIIESALVGCGVFDSVETGSLAATSAPAVVTAADSIAAAPQAVIEMVTDSALVGNAGFDSAEDGSFRAPLVETGGDSGAAAPQASTEMVTERAIVGDASFDSAEIRRLAAIRVPSVETAADSGVAAPQGSTDMVTESALVGYAGFDRADTGSVVASRVPPVEVAAVPCVATIDTNTISRTPKDDGIICPSTGKAARASVDGATGGVFDGVAVAIQTEYDKSFGFASASADLGAAVRVEHALLIGNDVLATTFGDEWGTDESSARVVVSDGFETYVGDAIVRFTITVPPGAPPGSLLQVEVPVRDTTEMTWIRIPVGLGAGSTMELTQVADTEDWILQVVSVVPVEGGNDSMDYEFESW